MFDDLVAAAAVALDTQPTPAAPAPAKEVALVRVDTSMDHVQIAQITGHGVGTGSGSGGTVTVLTTYYEDLCIAPCTFEVSPGLVELSAYGKGYRAAIDKFDLRAGDQVTLKAEPGSAALALTSYMLAVTGATAAITGGAFLAVPIDDTTRNAGWGMLLGGGAMLGAALPIGIASRGTFTREDPGQVVLNGRF